MEFASELQLPVGFYYREAQPVRKAVKTYDERLDFGFHPKTGQWVVFMKAGSTELTQDRPMILMGWNDIPSPDAAYKRLYQADSRKHGERLLKELNAHNEAVKAEAQYRASEASGEVAEHFEHAYRQEGLHPKPRIFVPGS